jgi:hypothetical protein
MESLMRNSAVRGSARSAGQKTTPSESDAAGGRKESTGAPRTFALLTVGAAAMGCLLALLPAAGHDQMWLLYAANLVRHGAKLYGPELFESNPPLIVWLSLIPSTLAGWLHLPATAVGKLLVCCVGAAVAFACASLLRESARISRAALWALAFVYVTAFAVIPARDFGQRDHLLAFLCLPYLICASRAMAGHPLAGWQPWLAGLAAGVGIALKPHQVVIIIAVEIALTATKRRLGTLARPEVAAILAVGLAYLAAIRAFAPDYVSQMLPLLRQTYWAFGHLTWFALVRESIQLHVLAAVTIGAAMLVRRPRPLTVVLLVAGFAAVFGYYLQRTGWYYQQLPALTFFSFALAFLLLELAQHRPIPMPRWAPATAATLCLLAVALTAHFMDYPFTPDRSFPIDTPDPSFFAGLPPGTPVATLTTTVDYTIPPVFKYHLILAQRYPHLWMLPAILRGESGDHPIPPAQLAHLELLQHDAMLEDFLRWQPRLVLVERCQHPAVHCQVLEDRHDNLLGWFLADPRFRTQFAHYRYLRSSGPFDAWSRID